ncbi:hypothetical protein JXA32_05655 [Candidatus Sumerlaeota bacterium]|nr:hypothetical protein [Candidatus Sumerlaeota bacterium]
MHMKMYISRIYSCLGRANHHRDRKRLLLHFLLSISVSIPIAIAIPIPMGIDENSFIHVVSTGKYHCILRRSRLHSAAYQLVLRDSLDCGGHAAAFAKRLSKDIWQSHFVFQGAGMACAVQRNTPREA